MDVHNEDFCVLLQNREESQDAGSTEWKTEQETTKEIMTESAIEAANANWSKQEHTQFALQGTFLAMIICIIVACAASSIAFAIGEIYQLKKHLKKSKKRSKKNA